MEINAGPIANLTVEIFNVFDTYVDIPGTKVNLNPTD
jgi:hypothetical protein